MADSRFAYTFVVDVKVAEGVVMVLLTSIVLFSLLVIDGSTSMAIVFESIFVLDSFLKFNGSFFGSPVPSLLILCSILTSLICDGTNISLESF